jgi:tetraprenyl-beta-curcumene synthase
MNGWSPLSHYLRNISYAEEATIIWTFCTKALPAVDEALTRWRRQLMCRSGVSCSRLTRKQLLPNGEGRVNPPSSAKLRNESLSKRGLRIAYDPMHKGILIRCSTTQPSLLPDLEFHEQQGTVLIAEGLKSIEYKRFHAQGGSVFAILPGRSHRTLKIHYPLLRLIVALQTISDYLDNLCDRAGVVCEEAFRQLHSAFIDAVTLDTQGNHAAYYSLFPFKRDNGYLDSLVSECKALIRRLPSYPVVESQVLHLAHLYSEMQAKKHTDPSIREALLESWFLERKRAFPKMDPSIGWWEFAAASGSTLGIFALLKEAAIPGLESVDADLIFDAYFPCINGLHILLDYFIDQSEDEEGGDLNFVRVYSDTSKCDDRLSYFVRMSFEKAAALSNPGFHVAVVKGLLALYLSDPKVSATGLLPQGLELLRSSGQDTYVMYSLCKLARRWGLV